MKRALALGVTALLALGACAPAPTLPGRPDAPSDPDPARFTLAREPQRLRLEAGPAPLRLRALEFAGADLRVNDARCTAQGLKVSCNLGGFDVPAGKAFALPVGGLVLWARATYARSDGAEHAKVYEHAE